MHETVNTIKKENVGMKEDIKIIKEENSELKKGLSTCKREACETIYYSLISVSLTKRTQERKELIKEELKIAEDVEFARVYRTGRKTPHKIRPIVAKFKKYKMREKVKFEGWKRMKEMKELKSNPVPGLNVTVDPKFADFGIEEQFPTEIYKTRKELLPIYRRALTNKQNAKLIVDQCTSIESHTTQRRKHMMTDSA